LVLGHQLNHQEAVGCSDFGDVMPWPAWLDLIPVSMDWPLSRVTSVQRHAAAQGRSIGMTAAMAALRYAFATREGVIPRTSLPWAAIGLDLITLRVFKAAVEERSLARAAEREHLALSALSRGVVAWIRPVALQARPT
jgi:hypothetical protein